MQAGFSYASYGIPHQMSYGYPQQTGGLTEQQLRQIYALQQPSYGAAAQAPSLYQQQPPGQNSQYVQPGSIAYTATQTPNGIMYQPVVAREVSVQTRQGLVKSLQYVPAGPHQGPQGQQPAAAYPQPASYGVQASHVSYPSQAQALAPGAMGNVPGVAYDMRTYGDAFSNGYPGVSPKDLKRAMKQRDKEERERRKLEERAAKKQQEWAKGSQHRLRAEGEELRRARERDRREEYENLEDHEDSYLRGRPDAVRSGVPGGAFNFAGAMGDLSINDEPRRRKMSTAGRSRPGSPSGINFGGPPLQPSYGATYGPGGPGGYVQERTINGIGARPGEIPGGPYPGAMGPGIVPGIPGAPAMAGMTNGVGVMPAPGGGIMPVPADRARTPYGGPNGGSTRSHPNTPSRVPISQMPPSPSNAVPTYGGAPSGASPYPRPGALPNGGTIPAPLYLDPAGLAGGGVAYSQAHAFSREPNPALPYAPFPRFDIVTDMDELFELLPEVPPLPAALVSHDVSRDDWARYMSDIIAAWQPNPQARLVHPPQRAAIVSSLTDTWNEHFFLRRGLHFIFDSVRMPSRHRSASRGSRGSRARYSDESESDNNDSDEPSESENEFDGPGLRVPGSRAGSRAGSRPGSRAGSRTGSHMGRRPRRRNAMSYSLTAECVPMRGRSGIPSAMSATTLMPGGTVMPSGGIVPGGGGGGGIVPGMVHMGGDPRLSGAPMGVGGMVDPRLGAAMGNPPATYQGMNFP
ncbi:uncharacterized protein EI90DRAFT_3033330 [Cantharellus anzutake]|uniref:uncharacterized protein n=1 Tax=Cantharellus anzutake TaxID=1750568 RepID=UPI0019068481|nr:uncharacterized protein EI90DRAFT_3033330 [Cantharellus anzutake]KAF8341280.1 hypothetical protein EI90DRAFT_3033330 [Cantharellus anzutake]